LNNVCPSVAVKLSDAFPGVEFGSGILNGAASTH
jgi:hypothetical protein